MGTAFGDMDRQHLELFVEELRRETAEFPADEFSGKGIVICAGGARIFTSAYVLIRVLRETLGCALPIEVWHFGSEEISPAMAAILESLGVSRVDALPLITEKAPRIRDGWQLKSFALLWSRFSEVLLLDADQVPVSDPSPLFDWPEYRKTGAIFWPDIVDIRSDNPVWSIFGLESKRRISLESGQLLIDKSRHWLPLLTALRLNEEADLLYRLIYGDKDTFLLAWMFRNAAYAMVSHCPHLDERYLVQRDFDGRPLFQHRANAKWNYAGEQLHFPKFAHEAVCLGFLDDLRQLWSGRVFSAPEQSPGTRRLELELVAHSPFILEVGDEPAIELEFRLNAELGRGRSHDRQNWWVQQVGSEYRLFFSDGTSRTYELRREKRGYWLGQTMVAAPSSQVILKPLPAPEYRIASSADIAKPFRGDTLATRYFVRDDGTWQ
jgi:hypothetical protein